MSRQKQQRVCKWCATPLTQENASPKSRYCSKHVNVYRRSLEDYSPEARNKEAEIEKIRLEVEMSAKTRVYPWSSSEEKARLANTPILTIQEQETLQDYLNRI